MRHVRQLLTATAVLPLLTLTGCATSWSLCEYSGGVQRGAYSGIRATVTDWKGGYKPWDHDGPVALKTAQKIYYRTIDVPVSLIADTMLLPLTVGLRASVESESSNTQVAEEGVKELPKSQ